MLKSDDKISAFLLSYAHFLRVCLILTMTVGNVKTALPIPVNEVSRFLANEIKAEMPPLSYFATMSGRWVR